MSSARLSRGIVAISALGLLAALISMSWYRTTHVRFCAGAALVPSSRVGAVDPRAALDAYLADPRSSGLPRTGWTGPVHEVAQGDSAGMVAPFDLVFWAGDYQVAVGRYQDRPGWFATARATCGYGG